MILRDYQHESIAAARALIGAGKKRVLLVCPTGGGKTVIASEVIRGAVNKGKRVLFLAHRRELIVQTCNKLRDFGVAHGVVMSGDRMALQHSTQVASVQTLIRRRDALRNVDLIFIDEAHHASARTYMDLIALWPDAKTIGLTATPWRQDGKGLHDIFDGFHVVRTPAQLRDEGWLVPVGGTIFESINTDKMRTRGGDYDSRDIAEATEKKEVVGDIVGKWLEYASGRPTVCFAATVAASEMLCRLFVERGVRAEHIDGDTPTEVRDAVLARARSGETQVLCNCNVLTEGFDFPALSCCILARPTLSTALYLQMVGRVLRPTEGKTNAIIHDHAGCLDSHGHPYDARDFSPQESDVTRGARGKDKAAVKDRQKKCMHCRSINGGAYPCPVCNFTPSPEALALRLQQEASERAIREASEAKHKQERTAKQEQRERAEKFMLLATDVRRERFIEMANRCFSPSQAKGRYRWWSGEISWPRNEWFSDTKFGPQ